MTPFTLSLPDGAVLQGACEGQGPDILLVSGLGGTGAFWEPVVRALAGRFRLIRFDQRGIGASSRGTAACTIAQLAADAQAILNHLDSRGTILVGHSTGGCIIQEMALRDPSRLAGLVLSGAWAKPSRYMSELFRSRLAVLRAAPREYAALGALISYPTEWLDRNWPRFEAAVRQAPLSQEAQTIVAERIEALLSFDRSGEIGAIGLPRIIIGAEDDLIVPPFLQRELAALLPQAAIAILPSGGHFFPVSRTEDFTALLSRWIDEAIA